MALISKLAGLSLFALSELSFAQSLMVTPVSIRMASGQLTATLSVTNQAEQPSAIQIRTFAWAQVNGKDELTPTNKILASPPLATIAPGALQIVRLVLRSPPQGREATYRIWFDQIPPPSTGGTVSIAIRLSIPIFAEPATRIKAQLQFTLERHNDQLYLIVKNDGNLHETLRNITLTAGEDQPLKLETNVSPYVLAGTTHRWRITSSVARFPAVGETVRVKARADAGIIDQPVPVVVEP